MATIGERLRSTLGINSQPSFISRPETTFFPLAKTDFESGALGDGGQALHNAFRLGVVKTGDALRMRLTDPNGEATREIDVFYVCPANPLFKEPSKQINPSHHIFLNGEVRDFSEVSQIGTWRIVEGKFKRGYVKRRIKAFAEKTLGNSTTSA
jgi:hypothetical protein